MIERLPDLLTGSRVILSIVLLFLEPLSVPFLTLYLVACITDFLDGHLARKMGCKTSYGPYFDSLADCLLVAVVVYSIIVHVEFDNWMIIWIVIIASVRIIAFLVGSLRYHKPAFIHSYLNKLTGMALFLLPFILVTISTPVAVAIVCSLASVSSAEYLLINILSDHYDPDCPSLLHL
ncbi:MAG: CDP-alcohol phosphatidyltransferase family protein [Candidatus Methanomethylophilaceae archaeon]|nr:CDP-alcohol phosphatidyltransferase family protein [Candidatus Methanomethylophilaceae archaeon]